jgi:hypothetical protein
MLAILPRNVTTALPQNGALVAFRAILVVEKEPIFARLREEGTKRSFAPPGTTRLLVFCEPGDMGFFVQIWYILI